MFKQRYDCKGGGGEKGRMGQRQDLVEFSVTVFFLFHFAHNSVTES